MRVRAKMLGYYGTKRKKAGEEFDIKDEAAFSKVWMEKVEAKAKAPAKASKAKPAKGKAEKEDLEVI